MARARNETGFTLIEMLVALSILLFGLTAVAGSLMMGVSTRRGTEMRFKAVHMVDHVFRLLQEDYFVEHDPDSGPLPPIGKDAQGVARPVEIPEYPGMKYTVTFLEDPDHAQVVLASVRISWKEQGEQVAEQFSRVMIREKPFSHRISQIRGSNR
jgi:prepilin-type N-terminal cleavage/methylation domain-containing protein